ncbi:MAG TPA: cyclic nucleotide-binding domain-containing protein [Acidimicrobiales bacterium]|jgi:CRP-like cAMP-binding protein
MRLTSPARGHTPTSIAPRDTLRRLELFHRLPDAELDQLTLLFEFASAKPGRLLARQDVPVDRWSILVSGHAVVERDATPIGLLAGGDSWSEHSLLNGFRSPISVVALSPVTTLSLGREAFFALPEDHPVVAGRLVARSASSPDRLARPVLNALIHMEQRQRTNDSQDHPSTA